MSRIWQRSWLALVTQRLGARAVVLKEVVVRWDVLLDAQPPLGFCNSRGAACAMWPRGGASGWRCWAGRRSGGHGLELAEAFVGSQK